MFVSLGNAVPILLSVGVLMSILLGDAVSIPLSVGIPVSVPPGNAVSILQLKAIWHLSCWATQRVAQKLSRRWGWGAVQRLMQAQREVSKVYSEAETEKE